MTVRITLLEEMLIFCIGTQKVNVLTNMTSVLSIKGMSVHQQAGSLHAVRQAMPGVRGWYIIGRS